MEPIRIAIAGAAGRMGQTILRVVVDDTACMLVGALEHSHHARIGADAGVVNTGDALRVTITADCSEVLRKSDALIDFTVPAASTDLARKAADFGIVHVIGTTGFDREQETRIEAAAQRTVIIKSGNMSVGANLLAALVAQAAHVLPDFDVQIVEMHHRMKKDAPSGTALMLGRAVGESRDLHAPGLRDQSDTSPLNHGVGFASLRGGTVVGEHTVVFAGTHERLILEHVAEDRTIFARGAVTAAKWGRGQKPGLYSMMNVLGLA